LHKREIHLTGKSLEKARKERRLFRMGPGKNPKIVGLRKERLPFSHNPGWLLAPILRQYPLPGT